MKKSNQVERSDQTLILVHGAGGSRMSWPRELRSFQGIPVSALDLPGHGRSDKPAMTAIKDLGVWLVNRLSGPSILVGHSLGGAVCLQAALEDPSHVLGLVLLSSGPRLPVHPQLLDELGNTEKYPGAVENILRWSFGELTDPHLVIRTRELLQALPPGLLQADFQACAEFDVRHRLQEIRIPTLVVFGAEDRMTPLSLGEELISGIRSSRMQMISGAGHMLPLEAPGKTAAAIKSFLVSFQD